MELRHLRCFLAVAEELHFARAAERLHIEQSPLSRAIKELEEELGARLFNRTTRSTRLTRAGQLFLKHVPRVFTALDQARGSVQAAAAGFHDQLRLALSDGITRPRLTALLAQCREEEPEVDIRLFEVPLVQQLRGLHDDVYDLGFAQSGEVDDGILAHPVWKDPIVVAMPSRHPLLAYRRIPLDEVLRYPLVACDPQWCEGNCRQIDRILRSAEREPLVIQHVTSLHLMTALVAAGYALALVGASQLAASLNKGIVTRPLAGRSQALTTWLLRRDAEPSETLRSFIERVTPISGDPSHEGDSLTSDTKGEN